MRSYLMRRILVLLLLSAACVWPQQPTTDPNQSPSSPAPPGAAQQPTPAPPQGSQQDKSGVNSQIQDNIRSVLSGDPALSGTSVEASVDDSSITLTGTVESQGQMQRVLQLVGPYAQYRQIVNKVQVH